MKMTGHGSGQLWRALISATTKLANLWGKGKVMSKSKETDTETDERPWWLKIPTGLIVAAVGLVGAGYVAYFVHLLAVSKDCKNYSGFWFVQDCLASLQTNNIGDALGGAFAPLAFVFLAGALIIQAMELAAQRYETNETQQVMRAQLDVARQQVEETKASTALLLEQTAMLKLQREQELANKQFDQQFELVIEIIRSLQSKLKVKIWYHQPHKILEGVRIKHFQMAYDALFKELCGTDIERGEVISRFLLGIAILTERLDRYPDHRSIDYIDEKAEKAFNHIEDALQKLDDMASNLTTDYRVKAQKLRVSVTSWRFFKLQEGIRKERQKPDHI
ncbi:hypothetical protein ACQZ61_06490 [Agrobacterium vitis]|uniref:hypothetical protein n=1 Tax=Agrobacterium vitis TaxID=373 RepID=UPI0015DB7284|nr:hypothetical protein [Agrobacterium vitis]MCF1454092.1 hypothetical protein [Agrobacterium vitis]BCH55263.1 hypothetical protein RvVAR031_28730 [Agrobacterium vitis]